MESNPFGAPPAHREFRTSDAGFYTGFSTKLVEEFEVDHKLSDAKGRKISGKAAIDAVTHMGWAYLQGESPNTVVYDRATGEYTLVPFYGPHRDNFAVFIYAMRDGKPFGASPKATYYPSLEAAQAAARKSLDSQAKRYAVMFRTRMGVDG